MTDTMEEWRDVPGYEGFYQISSLGRLRSLDRKSCNGKNLKGKILANTLDAKGYLVNCLCKDFKKKHFRRHQLVALAFIPNDDSQLEINHIDGNKLNNMVGNLEWITHKENCLHAWETGLTKPPPAETPKSIVQMTLHGKVIQEFQSIKIAAEATSIFDGDICKCCKGKRKTAGGYKWKYKEVAYEN